MTVATLSKKADAGVTGDIAASTTAATSFAAASREAHAPPRTILELQGVTLSFGGVVAVSNVDLIVKEREIRAVIGPNGAGKSSLINLISGIYRPDVGKIIIDGHEFARVPAQDVARLGLSRTYQNLALFRGLSVLENVISGLSHTVRSNFLEQLFGLPRARSEDAQARERADVVLEALKLQHVRDQSVATLPYGLQKRVELARAIISNPRILLLDEPMAGMTASEKAEMAGFVRTARDRFGSTIILIEHDVGVIMGLSDRVAVLDYGRKIADGTPTQIQQNTAVIDAYLGVVHEDGDEVRT